MRALWKNTTLDIHVRPGGTKRVGRCSVCISILAVEVSNSLGIASQSLKLKKNILEISEKKNFSVCVLSQSLSHSGGMNSGNAAASIRSGKSKVKFKWLGSVPPKSL